MRYRGDFVIGVLVGAGLMYLLDPQGGRRRRTVLTQKAGHIGRRAADTVSGSARDLGNRSRGAVLEARGRLRSDDASDEVLEARVRSELGHEVDDLSALTVVAENGRILLGGALPEADRDRVLKLVRRVRGVRAVESQFGEA